MHFRLNQFSQARDHIDKEGWVLIREVFRPEEIHEYRKCVSRAVNALLGSPWLVDDEIADRQEIDSGCKETTQRIARRQHHWLTIHIE